MLVGDCYENKGAELDLGFGFKAVEKSLTAILPVFFFSPFISSKM